MVEELHMPLGLNEIIVPEGRRSVDQKAVNRLAQSIEKIGLRHPISVRQHRDQYILVAGRHRLEAFRKLGCKGIPAVITSFTNLQAELSEIDENLCRTPAQGAATISRVQRDLRRTPPGYPFLRSPRSSSTGEGRRGGAAVHLRRALRDDGVENFVAWVEAWARFHEQVLAYADNEAERLFWKFEDSAGDGDTSA